MNSQFFRAVDNRQGLKLDPRTKCLLFLAVVIGVFMDGSGAFSQCAYYIMCSVPPIMLLFSAQYKKAFCYIAYIIIFSFLQQFAMVYTSGILQAVIALSCYIVLRFYPTMMMGYFMMSTTTVSEFMAAMNRMHISDKITIPAAVMFRFFPTVADEVRAIEDYMKMRGISLGGSKPLQILEYRMVPILMCSAKIGEELSQAALSRGLKAGRHRTNICEIGFRLIDFIFIGISIAAILLIKLG